MTTTFELVPRSILASPQAVAREYWRLLRSGELITHTAISLYRLGTGVGLGASAGIAFGAAVVVSTRMDAVFGGVFRFLAPVPPLAWTPFLIALAGIDGAKLALIVIGTFMVVASSTINGLRETRADYIEIAEMMELNRLASLRLVLLPSAAWSIFGGLRIAVALSWVLLLASEVIASSSGLGWLLWDARNFSRAPQVACAILTICLLGVATDSVLGRAQRRVANWAPRFAK